MSRETTGKENADVDVEVPEVQTMSGKNQRLYMPFRFDWVEQLAFIRPERLPGFLRAICDYSRDGTVPEFAEPLEQAIWIGISRDIKYYRERYERSRENGQKGGRPAKTQENPNEPAQTDRNPTEPTGNPKKKKEKEEKKEKKKKEESAPVPPSVTAPGGGQAAEAGGTKQNEQLFFDYDGDSRIHGITPERIGRWREQFPGLDVEAELNAASAWLDGNRKNRKTDLRRFLTNWLIRTQERARLDPGGGPRDFDLGVIPEKRRVWGEHERGMTP